MAIEKFKNKKKSIGMNLFRILGENQRHCRSTLSFWWLYHTAQVFTAVQLQPALSRCDTWPLTLSLHGSLWEIMLNISTRNLWIFFFFFFLFFYLFFFNMFKSWKLVCLWDMHRLILCTAHAPHTGGGVDYIRVSVRRWNLLKTLLD